MHFFSFSDDVFGTSASGYHRHDRLGSSDGRSHRRGPRGPRRGFGHRPHWWLGNGGHRPPAGSHGPDSDRNDHCRRSH